LQATHEVPVCLCLEQRHEKQPAPRLFPLELSVMDIRTPKGLAESPLCPTCHAAHSHVTHTSSPGCPRPASTSRRPWSQAFPRRARGPTDPLRASSAGSESSLGSLPPVRRLALPFLSLSRDSKEIVGKRDKSARTLSLKSNVSPTTLFNFVSISDQRVSITINHNHSYMYVFHLWSMTRQQLLVLWIVTCQDLNAFFWSK
jgi:hypothetical protein